MSTVDTIKATLREFGGNPHQAQGIATLLGFDPIHNPQDELSSGSASAVKSFFSVPGEQFGYGVKALYRVGDRVRQDTSCGLWVGVLSDWGQASADRDRSRRRITQALVDGTSEAGSLAFLTPPDHQAREEAELILPRAPKLLHGDTESQAVSITRATVNLAEPSDFHCALLDDLSVQGQPTLFDVARHWQSQFSVERVATKFYEEYAEVRDRIAKALKLSNPDHQTIVALTDDELRAWATRQMGRVLFLWFLQAKGWLGKPAGNGPTDYLLRLWGPHRSTASGEYYRGVLRPLFFEAMATGNYVDREHPILGHVPYLNGGLFRRNALEERINEDVYPISLPNWVFDTNTSPSLLSILQRYRVTTRESTPDDQSVDPDPEMLGRVLENLHQGDKRHDTGTYYTPREIVHFMCREALDGYLKDTVPKMDQGKLDALRQQATGSHDAAEDPIDEDTSAVLAGALENVRICDPAVGSGAFLVGMLQEIVLLRRGLLFSQQRRILPGELYQKISEWKQQIITKNLHGVDINPEAVEICQLRLWLSMVLDMPEPPGPDQDWALPNLDFSVVSGDSLVDRVGGIVFKESWPPPQSLQFDFDLRRQLDELERRIDRRRVEFDDASRNQQELRALSDAIARDKTTIIRLQLQDALDKARGTLIFQNATAAGTASERQAQELVDQLQNLLTSIEESDLSVVQKPFLWPVAFPGVLRDTEGAPGFDIVLGNPPYVRQEKVSAEDKQSLKEAFPEVYKGTGDILLSFYGRAIHILKPGGWLAFITSNRFMRAGYGDCIRQHLPQEIRIHRLIDFGALPVFRTKSKAVDANPVILIGSRSKAISGHKIGVTDLFYQVCKKLRDDDLPVNTENTRAELQNIHTLLEESEIREYPQILLGKDRWNLEEPAFVRLFERLMNQGVPLKTFARGRVHYGVKTGANRAFLVDRAQRDVLVGEDPSSADVIKPCMTSKAINRWRAEPGNTFLIAVPNTNDPGIENPWGHADPETVAEGIFARMYPAIHHHLVGHVRNLRDRRDQGKFWWELRSCTYYHAFAQPKILWGNLAVESKFALDESGAYVSSPANCLVAPEPWLIAVMNSSLLNFIYPRLTVTRHDSFQEFKIGYIAATPIVTPDEGPMTDLCSLVNEIMMRPTSDHDVAEIEQEIDSIVFHLYDVPVLERKLILDWLSERREAAGSKADLDWRRLNALRATAGAWRYNADADLLLRELQSHPEVSGQPMEGC